MLSICLYVSSLIGLALSVYKEQWGGVVLSMVMLFIVTLRMDEEGKLLSS